MQREGEKYREMHIWRQDWNVYGLIKFHVHALPQGNKTRWILKNTPLKQRQTELDKIKEKLRYFLFSLLDLMRV